MVVEKALAVPVAVAQRDRSSSPTARLEFSSEICVEWTRGGQGERRSSTPSLAYAAVMLLMDQGLARGLRDHRPSAVRPPDGDHLEQ